MGQDPRILVTLIVFLFHPPLPFFNAADRLINPLQLPVMKRRVLLQNLIPSSRQFIQHRDDRSLDFKFRSMAASTFVFYTSCFPSRLITPILANPEDILPFLIPFEDCSTLSADQPSLQTGA